MSEFPADFTESVPDAKLAEFAEPRNKSFALLATIMNEQRRKLRIEEVKAKFPGGNLAITELMKKEQRHGKRLKGSQNRTLRMKEFVKLDGIERKVVYDRLENLLGQKGALFDNVGVRAVRKGFGKAEGLSKNGLNVRDRVASGSEFKGHQSKLLSVVLNPVPGRIRLSALLSDLELRLKMGVLLVFNSKGWCLKAPGPSNVLRFLSLQHFSDERPPNTTQCLSKK